MHLTVATLVTALLLGGPAHACAVVTDVKITFYGAPDNDPPGPATAYDCGGRNYIAGGTGTYEEPLTFATAPGEYDQCKCTPSPLTPAPLLSVPSLSPP